VSHPDGLPDLFLDRSLGRKKVPQLLRESGLRLVTLAEHYGVPADEIVEDTDWLALCGERGWLAVMKDSRIQHVSAERRALVVNGVQAVVIPNANLSASDMAGRVIRSAPELAEICQARSGPFLFGLHLHRIVEISLDERFS
jgi:hypothetical protein